MTSVGTRSIPDSVAAAAATEVVARRRYLDWLRGVAVLLMIEAHLFDSWIAAPDRHTALYRAAMIVGGMGTVLFLLLAGASVGLSAGAKLRRGGDARSAAHAVAWRGLEIFALAFLFRLQAWILGWSSNPQDLLRVDILNIMGLSIIAAALLWRLPATVLGRVLTLAVVAVAIVFVTPLPRHAQPGPVPDPIEAYFVPIEGMSSFVFFPWAAFVFAGACIGVIIDMTRTTAGERRLALRLAGAGAVLAVAAFAASRAPSPYARSDYWTSSPAYFLLRLGLVMAGTAGAYAWSVAMLGRGQWSPLAQLGRTSLFIYWIHVELIYGLISRPLHGRLTLPQAMVALVLFTALMLACSMAKDRTVAWYRGRQRRKTTPNFQLPTPKGLG